MLVHDYDDEHTLQEEEQMSNSDASNELDELQKVNHSLYNVVILCIISRAVCTIF